MKAAVVACGVAVVFLAAVLVGMGQRHVADRRPPGPIVLREATRPGTGPTPQPSSTIRTVDRYVDHRGLDYYDDHGGLRPGNGGGSGSGSGRGGGDGSGDDSGHGGSSHGGSGSGSGSGSGDDD